MTRQIVENLELFSEAQLESLEFLPEELENIESELYPNLESISLEEVAKDLEAYFDRNIEEVGLEVKAKPKHPNKYSTHDYSGRTYYSRKDPQGRVTKIAGPLKHTIGKRVGTLKVSYKRKGDQSGHLIAHSLGGPPRLDHNYVAMKREINAAGGQWGKMESYIRKRLKANGSAAWMSVEPVYKDDKNKRPIEINVTVKFNRPPKEKKYNIKTP
ncbi:DNA/RNA non-specific endonuclease [Nostoc sp. FACHB-133]|uniref:DNA/RNA non-specific endonuclease n=1 Tax=Nostoc sp. FACHB-133 TaxID=2692835 RepID=UPI0016868BCD|nr:DNA/RNA non-specific endonuclease [Nostoc sp. FACHB-133]MBD2526674.1 DNA/RNA non-specific endonuclease [Nostoc sp. FACHB-133]